jgi:hypothetical protein
MALEPEQFTAETIDQPDPELVFLTTRLIVAVCCALPLFALSMSEMLGHWLPWLGMLPAGVLTMAKLCGRFRDDALRQFQPTLALPPLSANRA